MFAKQNLRFVVAELGMGESVEDRAGMLVALSTLNPQRIRTNKRFGSR
jgi:hypothetical protein